MLSWTLVLRTMTAIGVACLVAAAVLWTMENVAQHPPSSENASDGSPGTPTSAPQPAPGPAPEPTSEPAPEPPPEIVLLGPCVQGICLEPDDPGIDTHFPYASWRITPSSLDVLDVTLHGTLAGVVLEGPAGTLLAIVDMHAGQFAHMEGVPRHTRPVWGDRALHWADDDGLVTWNARRSVTPGAGVPIAYHEQIVTLCEDTLCDREAPRGLWLRSAWEGHVLRGTMGTVDSTLHALHALDTDGSADALAQGRRWSGLAGNGSLAAWLEMHDGQGYVRMWDGGLATWTIESATAPAVAAEQVLFVQGAEIRAHTPGGATTVLATVPLLTAPYPLSGSDTSVAFSLHPDHGGSHHHLVRIDIPRT